MVLVVQGFWQSRLDTILHTTLVSSRNLSFFVVVVDVVAADVVVDEVDVVVDVVVDVEVVDTESFIYSDW